MTTTISDAERDALKEYAALKVEMRSCEERLKQLKPTVESALIRVDAQLNPIQTEHGKFTLRPRRLWTYSDELEARIEQVKADQKTEQATGLASFEEVRDVYFK